jgi:hypothetical protein
VDYVIVDCAFTYLSLLHLFFEYSDLIAFFSETKFTSMPYACKEHIQVYVVAKYEFDEQRKLKIDHIVHV